MRVILTGPGAGGDGMRRGFRWEGFCVIAAVFFLMSSSLLKADGGVTLAQIEREGLRVTVFAAPVPVRAGLLDVSFLAQDIASHQVVGEVGIYCSVLKVSPPSSKPVRLPAWCLAITPGMWIAAEPGHSGNKLLKGAYVPVPEPGRWELRVRVSRGGGEFTATLPFEVHPPLPPLSTWWPLIAMAPCGIFLYIWRASLLRAQRRSRGAPAGEDKKKFSPGGGSFLS